MFGRLTVSDNIPVKMVVIYLSFIFCIITAVSGKTEKCTAPFVPDLKLCAADPDNSTVSDDAKLNIPKCKSHIPLCKRGFQVGRITMQPLDSILEAMITKVLIGSCCGACGPNLNLESRTFESFTSLLNSGMANSTHLIYPVLAKSDAVTLHGYHYIPFLGTRNGFYITLQPSKESMMRQLITSCANLWPLLIIMLLMALIAGFFVWIIETWVNEEMFPRTFLKGIFDAFWWSFISMTTVGYGDKAPTHFVSRLISVLWVVIGITVCGMFTASLTSDITNAVTPKTPTLLGNKVGVIRGRLYLYSLVSKHGGIVVETKSSDLKEALGELITNMKNKSEGLDGFIIDQFSYALMNVAQLRNKANINVTDEHVSFIKEKCIITEQNYYGDKLSYGVMVKEVADYEYLKPFVLDNQIGLETCMDVLVNPANLKAKKTASVKGHNIFSPETALFQLALVIVISMVGFILLFGVVYEVTRKHKLWSTRKVTGDA